jgi:hypothetical protein
MQLDQDDLIASSSSGSGWNINDQFTDDEDLISEHMYGSGSGHLLDNVEPTFGSDDNIISSTSSPSLNNKTKSTETSTKNVNAGSSSSRRSLQGSNLYSFMFIHVLLYCFINTDYVKLF